MSGTDSPRPVWRKSSASANQDCVEVAYLAGGTRALRDSKNPGGPVIAVGCDGWAAFVAGLKDGEAV
ncbi:DUF397 domain-containing protein [Sphaerisporangium rubeum]|uniref:DUF397 domain-containing protein n=1 Tax=Sphaerisporangium rubeum TaxID=321317 RepID=A0A7X0M6V5_9ACTN|nr:DUF397 domain-containing protein [Sphaerisporangium rubeum]MBB6472236.1 hypothetical protein [Sphaerisporangium rubeum]